MRRRILAPAVVLALVLFGTQSATAGSASPPAAATLIGHWTFDEGTGTTAADSSGAGHPLTLQGGASWATGVVGPSALAVSPQQDAASAGPVIDTSRSFTVSAWVDLARTSGFQTFVSEDGTQVSGFYLQLRGDTGRFAFTRLAYDATAAYGMIATSPIVPQPGVWYQLTGEYDATAQTLSLYVDGALQQTIHALAPWSASGPLAVGRGFFGGNPTDWVSGTIDDVRAYAGEPPREVRALAGTGSITVHEDQPGPALNPTQLGAFLEEINHSGDGGVYAELVHGGATAAIALDSSQPLSSANPVALRLTVGSLPPGGRAGIANAGYWGVPVTPGTTYHLSFYARADASFAGPLTASLESSAGRVWATVTIPAVTTGWARYTATLSTASGIPATLDNRLAISTSSAAAAGSSVLFTLVSLFPPTYDGTANGLRIDLMQKIAALHPGYLRIPGGNYLEGSTLSTYFNWKLAIGPIQDRPGHLNSAWGYWSQDGMGLLEYLEMAEELGAQPILAVFAGYTLNHTVVPQGQLAPYVQDALDEIQYAIGPVTSTWGARRAADGHPAPFDLHYVEVGNEDQFDTSGSYNAYRFPMFYDAIKAAYPQLKIIATTNVTSRTPDVIDDHYYYSSDPSVIAGDAHNYDSTSRTGPRHIVGEYAVTQGSPTGTLAGALGEAAFLTGLERDADVVIGASYAPLLVNVNAVSWPTNLIGYDGLVSYGSPSYYAQKMLGDSLGDQVAPSQIVGGNGNLWTVASTKAGHTTYLTVVNRGDSPAMVDVDLAGVAAVTGGTSTVLTGSPDAMNSIAHPTAISPATSRLGPAPASFRHTFPANSLTVLTLATSSASRSPTTRAPMDASSSRSATTCARRTGRPPPRRCG
ncbi:MAG TPA: alpha-L-arabinofuranosidase C-terminal domain-containing protein [Streptosporangiaceae bacterium]|nr:alpha-L-arabinofuranosidase C-terminal domain-containing protein [Streptosporangiaceae bacterium]